MENIIANLVYVKNHINNSEHPRNMNNFCGADQATVTQLIFIAFQEVLNMLRAFFLACGFMFRKRAFIYCLI